MPRPSHKQAKFKAGILDREIIQRDDGLFVICGGNAPDPEDKFYCGAMLKIGRDAWHAGHYIANAIKESYDPDDGRPQCKVCNAQQNSQQDIKQVTKSRSVRKSHRGTKPLKGRGFRGHRKFNGDLVWNDR